MKDRNKMDNLYEEGTIICAKENPTLKLVITKYSQRIYYCTVPGDTTGRRFAYFESNLIPPVNTNAGAPSSRAHTSA
jgi:hypothetical protein